MLKQADVWTNLFAGRLWEIPFILIIQAPSVLPVILAHYFVTIFTFLILCLLNSLTYCPSCAVSPKQMRNLKYILRYPGLTLWPCWMHQIPNIITRCTEPFGGQHQSLFVVSPPWLPVSLALHAISHHSQTKCSPLPGLNSHCVVQHCSFLKYLWLKT